MGTTTEETFCGECGKKLSDVITMPNAVVKRKEL